MSAQQSHIATPEGQVAPQQVMQQLLPVPVIEAFVVAYEEGVEGVQGGVSYFATLEDLVRKACKTWSAGAVLAWAESATRWAICKQQADGADSWTVLTITSDVNSADVTAHKFSQQELMHMLATSGEEAETEVETNRERHAA